MVLTKVISCVRWAVPVAALSVALSGSSRAEVLTGTADAYALSATGSYNIMFIGSGSDTTGKLVDASVSSPAAADDANGASSFVFNAPSSGPLAGDLIHLATGALTTSAASDVDGFGGARTTYADSGLANSALTLLSSPLSSPLFSFSVGSIQQTAAVTGDYGSLSATGSLTITDLLITSGNTTILSLTGTHFIAANEVISTGLAGVSLILNEQITSGDGITSKGMVTNAIHLSVDASLAGFASLGGDVTLGHAEAFQTAAVPEPTSVALLGLGVLGAGLVGYRRRAAA